MLKKQRKSTDQTTRIKDLIQKKYCEEQQQLNLSASLFVPSAYADDWIKVLRFRDWTEVRALWLDQCRIGDKEVGVLGKLDWPELQKLSLYNNQITTTGLKKLLKTNLPSLTELNLYKNLIDDEGLSHLFLSDRLQNLQSLIIDGNKITMLGMRAMVESQFRRIRWLSLCRNGIGSRGVALLIKADFPLLERLGLNDCQLGDMGFQHVSKGKWPLLNELYLPGNKIVGNGYTTVAHSNWKQLTQIRVNVDHIFSSIALLSLLATNWTKTVIKSRTQNPKITQNITALIFSRYQTK